MSPGECRFGAAWGHGYNGLNPVKDVKAVGVKGVTFSGVDREYLVTCEIKIGFGNGLDNGCVWLCRMGFVRGGKDGTGEGGTTVNNRKHGDGNMSRDR